MAPDFGVRREGRTISWMLLPALVAAAAVAAFAPPAAAVPTAPTEASGAAAETPSEQAARTGVRVEVPEKTTESEQVFANPDGTFTLEASAVPVRARKGGAWVPVDPTLERRSDGVVVPRATTFGIELSGGGSAAPLARATRGGRSLSLSWPAALPVPVLSGGTATYREVFPGVDLVLVVSVDTLSEVLVVKNADAARNPALRKVTFGWRGEGVSLRQDDGGGFRAVDGHGLPVFVSPRPTMWDSRATDAAKTGASGDRVHGPRDGDKVAPMGLEVAAQSLAVVPDTTLLTAADTRFPLYIDPTIAPGQTDRAMVNQRYPNSTYFNWLGDSNKAEGMGYITDSSDGWHRKRLFYRFRTDYVAGKQILAATFKAYETWAYNCTKSAVDLWVPYPFSTSTDWNNQPSWRYKVSSRTVAYGYSGCSPGGAWVEFDAWKAIDESARNGWSRMNFGLRAGNESQANTSWKRFRYDAGISITYNSVPAQPTSPRTISPATDCVTDSDPAKVPAIPNDPPILVARLNDADGAKGQNVRGHFMFHRKGDATATQYITPYKLPGVDFTYQLPALADGHYSWRVRTYDGVTYGPYSVWCDFRVDSTRPATPTVTAPDGQTYVKGQDATFTFGPGGSTDVTRYRWSLNADAPTSGDVAATSPTVTTPLSFFGPTAMRAWSYDAVGNPSNPNGSLEFTVAGESPRNQWRFDEGAGTTTVDAIRGETLTLSGGCSWTTGADYDLDPTDQALQFDGTNGAATYSSGLLWMNNNFSVTAWVRVADATSKRVAVSQQRHPTSGFSLGVQPASAAGQAEFFFSYSNPDTSAAVKDAVVTAPALVGEWVHLAAVYEAGTKELTLYVDGAAVSSVNAPFSGIAPAGPFVVGQGYDGGAATYFWNGDVDEVRAFHGALIKEQVVRVYLDSRS